MALCTFSYNRVTLHLQRIRCFSTCSVCWVDPAAPASQSRRRPWRWWRAAGCSPPRLISPLSSDCRTESHSQTAVSCSNQVNAAEILHLRILLRVSLMWGNFSLNVSFMSFFRSDGLTYSITVVWGRKSRGENRSKEKEEERNLFFPLWKQEHLTNIECFLSIIFCFTHTDSTAVMSRTRISVFQTLTELYWSFRHSVCVSWLFLI